MINNREKIFRFLSAIPLKISIRFAFKYVQFNGQKWIGRELKGENTQGKIWELGRQSWRKMGLIMNKQKEKP